MTRPCRMMPAWFLMLFPAVASAQAPRTAQAWKTVEDLLSYERILNGRETEKPYATRDLILREEPTDRVQEVYVAGEVSTILRLPSKLAARGTGVYGGGEHRFEVVIADRKVFITPTQTLAKGERFPMIVTLVDGTAIRLSLTSAPEGEHADGEVLVTKEPEKPEELRVQLVAMTERARSFEERLRQALREQESTDHQLAGMLAGGRADLAAFIRVKERQFVDGVGRKVDLLTYASPPDAPHTANEVAAVFTIINEGTRPLEFSAARAVKGLGPEPVALAFRFHPRVIPAGERGFIAVVLNRASLGLGDEGRVVMDFFSKAGGGRREFSVDLVIEDFEEASPWWRFW